MPSIKAFHLLIYDINMMYHHVFYLRILCEFRFLSYVSLDQVTVKCPVGVEIGHSRVRNNNTCEIRKGKL